LLKQGADANPLFLLDTKIIFLYCCFMLEYDGKFWYQKYFQKFAKTIDNKITL